MKHYNIWGGYYSLYTRKGGQAIGVCLPRLPKGGQRHKADIGGDSYGC